MLYHLGSFLHRIFPTKLAPPPNFLENLLINNRIYLPINYIITYFSFPGQPMTVLPPPVVLNPTLAQPIVPQVNSQDALRRAHEQAQVGLYI